MPYLSIIIPTYNRATYLKSTLILILEQSFQDFEVVIVDDGSEDNTSDIVSSFEDKRIKYYFQQNQGVSVARNTGANFATSNYLVFLDSDDSFEQKWLTDFIKVITDNDYDLICCGVRVMKRNISKDKTLNDEIISAKEIYKRLLAGAFAIKKDYFINIGQYDCNMRFGENTELSIRIQANPINVGFIDSTNLIYFPTADGGGRNLKNRAESNIYCLNKHKEWFENHKRVKRMYLQSTAVALYKLSHLSDSKKYFLKAWKNNPMHVKGFLRLFICHFPLLAKLIWKKEESAVLKNQL